MLSLTLLNASLTKAEGTTITNPSNTFINKYGDTKLLWPVPSALKDQNDLIISCFGYRGMVAEGASFIHPGIDIPENAGEAVVAVEKGEVYGLKTSLGAVTIDHENGLMSTYAHMRKVFVKKGDAVEKGQIIGEVGDVGSGGRNHLHFEITDMNNYPYLLYNFYPTVISSSIGIASGVHNVNPMCFYDDKFFESKKEDFTWEWNIGCSNICHGYKDSKTCLFTINPSSRKTTSETCDEETGCVYKYCDFYNTARSTISTNTRNQNDKYNQEDYNFEIIYIDIDSADQKKSKYIYSDPVCTPFPESENKFMCEQGEKIKIKIGILNKGNRPIDINANPLIKPFYPLIDGSDVWLWGKSFKVLPDENVYEITVTYAFKPGIFEIIPGAKCISKQCKNYAKTHGKTDGLFEWSDKNKLLVYTS